jgi:6-phosphogluconolactonase/glucosamine-6-phosphate isomerase/deaminase
MQYILTSDNAAAISDLQARLIAELTADKKVLWLVSGGSNIDASVTIMANIEPALQSTLIIMLSDERYGPVGHPDSNFQQLQDKGFSVSGATLIPTLQPGLSLDETATAYAAIIQEQFSAAEIIISQLGIGADGHIAGILPESPAASSPDALVIGYQSNPFERITCTFRALQAIDANYSLVYGADKQDALTRLQQNEVALVEQPSQILKQLPEAYVYNDQVGDAL